MPSTEWLSSTLPFCLDVSALEPANHGLNPLKSRVKINLSSHKFFLLGIFIRVMKSWLTHHLTCQKCPNCIIQWVCETSLGPESSVAELIFMSLWWIPGHFETLCYFTLVPHRFQGCSLILQFSDQPAVLPFLLYFCILWGFDKLPQEMSSLSLT